MTKDLEMKNNVEEKFICFDDNGAEPEIIAKEQDGKQKWYKMYKEHFVTIDQTLKIYNFMQKNSIDYVTVKTNKQRAHILNDKDVIVCFGENEMLLSEFEPYDNLKLRQALEKRIGASEKFHRKQEQKAQNKNKSMSLIKDLENKIKERTSAINKEQILSHNRERFKAHFNDGEGDIFVYPHECVKTAEDGKKHGYVYRGVYQGADLLGVRVYENKEVELNEFKDMKSLKNKNGKDLFSLDELVEFDYENTQKVWKREMFHASPNKNKMKAIKEVLLNRETKHTIN